MADSDPSKGESGGVSYFRPCDVWGPHRRSKIQSTSEFSLDVPGQTDRQSARTVFADTASKHRVIK